MCCDTMLCVTDVTAAGSLTLEEEQHSCRAAGAKKILGIYALSAAILQCQKDPRYLGVPPPPTGHSQRALRRPGGACCACGAAPRACGALDFA